MEMGPSKQFPSCGSNSTQSTVRRTDILFLMCLLCCQIKQRTVYSSLQTNKMMVRGRKSDMGISVFFLSGYEQGAFLAVNDGFPGIVKRVVFSCVKAVGFLSERAGFDAKI